jgi:hypothetical protein
MDRLPATLPSRLRTASRRAGAGDRERGDIVLSWLTKLAVLFGLGGIVLFDAISVGVASVNVADQGSFAAREASETWQATKDLQKAYTRAVAVAEERDPGNVIDPATFRIEADNTVHLHISRTATTLVLYRIGPLEELAEVERDAAGRSVG